MEIISDKKKEFKSYITHTSAMTSSYLTVFKEPKREKGKLLSSYRLPQFFIKTKE
jgi:hypothetical protein